MPSTTVHHGASRVSNHPKLLNANQKNEATRLKFSLVRLPHRLCVLGSAMERHLLFSQRAAFNNSQNMALGDAVFIRRKALTVARIALDLLPFAFCPSIALVFVRVALASPATIRNCGCPSATELSADGRQPRALSPTFVASIKKQVPSHLFSVSISVSEGLAD
jgi:hypothetical protein